MRGFDVAIRSVARLVWFEALRGRLFRGAVVVALLVLFVVGFVDSLALTEARETRAAISAFLLRLALMFVFASFITFGLAREFSDRQVPFALSAPISRGRWLWGRYLGLMLAAAPLVLVAALVLLFSGSPTAVLAWAMSFYAELLVVAAFALFVGLALPQGATALTLTLGFYLLARVFADLQLIAQGAFATSDSGWLSVLTVFGWLLPRLDRFADSAWLVMTPPMPWVFLLMLLEAVIYIGLLLAAAWVDLTRKVIA